MYLHLLRKTFLSAFTLLHHFFTIRKWGVINDYATLFPINVRRRTTYRHFSQKVFNLLVFNDVKVSGLYSIYYEYQVNGHKLTNFFISKHVFINMLHIAVTNFFILTRNQPKWIYRSTSLKDKIFYSSYEQYQAEIFFQGVLKQNESRL